MTKRLIDPVSCNTHHRIAARISAKFIALAGTLLCLITLFFALQNNLPADNNQSLKSQHALVEISQDNSTFIADVE